MIRALIGAGGHASEVMAQLNEDLPCFVEDEYASHNTIPMSEFNPTEYSVMVAIGDSKLRRQIINRLPKETDFFSFIHPTALIMDNSVKIGVGSFIGANCILTTNIKIGDHALLNRGNHISHDCCIGNYFSAMPNAILSGNVKIGDEVYLGGNSSIREEVEICDKVTIGMGGVVTRSIRKHGTYVGVPVRIKNKVQ